MQDYNLEDFKKVELKITRKKFESKPIPLLGYTVDKKGSTIEVIKLNWFQILIRKIKFKLASKL